MPFRRRRGYAVCRRDASFGAASIDEHAGQLFTGRRRQASATEYERGLREIVVLLHESANQMAAIVDRPSAAKARFAKLIENGGNGLMAAVRALNFRPWSGIIQLTAQRPGQPRGGTGGDAIGARGSMPKGQA